jgi:hypothetical protein
MNKKISNVRRFGLRNQRTNIYPVTFLLSISQSYPFVCFFQTYFITEITKEEKKNRKKRKIQLHSNVLQNLYRTNPEYTLE